MSKTVNEIAKLTIAELAKTGTLLTPQNYEQMYEKLAAKLGVSSGRAERINKYLDRLSAKVKEEAQKAAPSNEAELISFLISRVNASKQTGADSNATVILLRALFKLMTRNLSSGVRELAIKSQENLKAGESAIVGLKNIWLDELSELCAQMDEYLMHAKKLGLSGDAASDLEKLENGLGAADKLSEFCEKLAPVMAYSLTPSIANDANTQISKIKAEVTQKPITLAQPNWSALASELIKQRIELDRAEISSSHRVLDELLNQVGSKIENILKMATSSEEKISQIRKEIAEIKSDNPAMRILQERLLHIVMSLESEVNALKVHTQNDVIQLGELQDKMSGLQQEIDKLKEESQQDFLTQLGNKRALESQLAAAEDGFNLYNINYSVLFFDIDHFKQINDTYGHTAGDVILAAIGNIISQHCRKIDTAGRYGGEEFMLILPHTDTEQAKRLAEQIREQVAANKFIYKDKQVKVTISGGAAQRNDYQNKEQLVESVDKLLYAAKAAGRNTIKA